jgi:hypothetical protein
MDADGTSLFHRHILGSIEYPWEGTQVQHFGETFMQSPDGLCHHQFSGLDYTIAWIFIGAAPFDPRCEFYVKAER